MKSWLIVLASLAALSASAVTFVHLHGWTLYYGDAEAHLDIARRIVDSRTPGYGQLGTVWLPLPHVLMLPLVVNGDLWRSGLAGAIPSAVCFVIAGLFLFATAQRLFHSVPAAVAAVACFATNPNLLYLQSTPMTEAVLFASVLAMLYCMVRFAESDANRFVVGAGIASVAASMTRYEGWFLVPFVALFFLMAGEGQRLRVASIFCLVAGTGPVYWLAHNYWYYGNALEFFNGPYSAKAIQGGKPYPGEHDWALSWLYYRTTIQFCAGWGLIALGCAGAVAALLKRVWIPLLFLALAPAFYVWSMHSSGTPIHIPTLWPHSYYNTRYGLSPLPLLAFCCGALVLLAPMKWRALTSALVVLISLAPWLLNPRPESWITWKESQYNSDARRVWTSEAARYLESRYRPGTGIVSQLNDQAGIFREAGIPFRDLVHDGNHPAWDGIIARPDLFLHEEWAITMANGPVERAVLQGHKFHLAKSIEVKDAPIIKIYKRD